MARPSTLAVLMLMTNSNLVGCITGSSEGLAPWRIRLATTPTKPPAVGNSRLARLCGGYCQGQGWTPRNPFLNRRSEVREVPRADNRGTGPPHGVRAHQGSPP